MRRPRGEPRDRRATAAPDDRPDAERPDGSRQAASGLRTEGLSFAYRDEPILEGLDLELPAGRITAIIGANGSGKSTVLKNLARLLEPAAGAVYLGDQAIHRLPTRLVAQQLAVLPQSPQAPEGLKVRELVRYGRHPWQGTMRPLTAADEAKVDEAIALANLEDLAHRPVGSLSGGQRQRAWIALALAQDSPLLLLDEPTTSLDLAHQFEVLQLLERLNREGGKTVVLVLHDINHASRYAHHVIALHAGRVVASGPPRAVLTVANLRTVYGIEVRLIEDPVTGGLLCLPVG